MVTQDTGSPLLAFSTLACPEWSALEVIERAAAMGFGGIEWRGGPDGHAGTHMPAADRRAMRAAMDAHGLVAIAVTTYTDLVHPSADVRRASVDDLLGHAEVAAALGAPSVRAFPGERSDDAPEEALLDRLAEGLRSAADGMAGSGVAIAIEPHDAFMASAPIGRLLARLDHPGVGALWDAGNTWSIGETPDEGLSALGPWLRYVQVKDGVGRLPDWRLTLLGEGEVPLGRAVELLAHDHPALPVSIEWERPWHPELPPADVALPQALAHLRRLYASIDPTTEDAP
jgi:sugar phosphate isomerase/epimerase